jgi:hypothetical protein
MSIVRSPGAPGTSSRYRSIDPGIGRVILRTLAVLLVALAASQALGRLEAPATRVQPIVIAVEVPDLPRRAVRPASLPRHPQARTIGWTPV